MNAPDPKTTHHWLPVFLRGLLCRCPRCGHGKLFARYLKPVEHCAVCGERLGDIRAEDGPAWLTLLIVGHIVGPAILAYGADNTWPEWVSFLFWPGLALALALVILPRAKGLFIAMLWRQRAFSAS